MIKKLLYLSLALNFFILISGYLFLQRMGGLKYLLIRLERAHNGIEYVDQVSQFKILPDTDHEIIFLGNSITSRGQWSELFNSKCINRGIGGDDSDRILLRLDEIANRKPDKIFIMIGINDLGKDRSIDYIMSNYTKVVQILAQATPHSTLYLQSVLPINNKIRNHRRSNQDIEVLNTHIENLAHDHKLTYIDLYSHFIDQDGQLKSELTTDGIHINGNGYLVWRNTIKDYVLNTSKHNLVKLR